MKPLHILIVDDEQPARRKIRNFLSRLEGAGQIFEAANGMEAAAQILQHNVDLVFLDIQMPGMSGFEVVESVGAGDMPAVIFVTAFDQYAIEAFEIEAIDYLLKPYDFERFKKSYQRALDRIGKQPYQADTLAKMVQQLQQQSYISRLLVKSGKRIYFVRVKDIFYLTAEQKYVNIQARDGTHLIRDSIGRLEQRLDPEHFARIHRSHIVNIDSVRELQPLAHGDYVAIIKNDQRLPVSRRYRERLFDRLP